MSKQKKTSRPNRNGGGKSLAQAQQLLSHGLDFHQKGQYEQAQAYYGQVLKQYPRHFEAVYLSGILAHQTQNYPRALELLSQAVEINPAHVGAYYNLGVVLQALKEFSLAVEAYDKAISLQADHIDAYINRGNVLLELKEFDLAIQSYIHAIGINPSSASAYYNLAFTLQERGAFSLALKNYDNAIALEPDFAQAYSNRGMVLKELGQFEEALQSCDKAIALNPHYPSAYNSRGIVLNDLKQFEAALQSYDKAIAFRPDYAEAWNNRGNTLYGMKQYEAAIENIDKAIALKPDYAEAYNNRGIVLKRGKNFTLTIANFNKAIALKPDFPEAVFNKAGLDLLKGDFVNGWEGYEWRRKNKELGILERVFEQPQWDGRETLQNKTILLYTEQGLGDTLQFSRYAKLVAGLGAKVILEVQAPLVELLRNVEGATQVIAQDDPLPPYDYHYPLLSLPLAFKTDLDSIPELPGYLAVDEKKVATWSSRLGEKTRPRIGIVWSGNPRHKNDSSRSIALQNFVHLLSEDYEFISLQKDIQKADQAVLKAHPEILDVSADLNDFTDTAALCELMDIVISVDTSVLHLAASLGRPSWCLIHDIPDWRWLLDRSDSPWYSSVKLYRQKEAGNWKEVLERVKADLQQEFSLNQ